jgi:hypothetical protein
MIRWPWQRKPIKPLAQRALRIVLSVDGRDHFDISSPLALSMIHCHRGEPIVHALLIDGPGLGDRRSVKLTLSEVDP